LHNFVAFTHDIHPETYCRMPGISPEAMVVDTRGHLMGRLASIVAKLVPTGNKAVIVR
jgi:ribosomal protein L13